MEKSHSLSLLCVSSVFIFAGLCGGPGVDPCEYDVLACQANLYDFTIDKDCDLTGELAVEVGGGESSYVALPERQPPVVYSGGQGGQHIFVGLRITNAALDRYDKVLARFGVYSQCEIGAPCYSFEVGEFTCSDREADAKTGVCESILGERTAVLGSAKSLRVVDDGIVEEYGLLVILDNWPVWNGTGVIRAVVLDPCEQSGTAEHTFPGESREDTGR